MCRPGVVMRERLFDVLRGKLQVHHRLLLRRFEFIALTVAANIKQAAPECLYQDESYFDAIMRVRRHRPSRRSHLPHN